MSKGTVFNNIGPGWVRRIVDTGVGSNVELKLALSGVGYAVNSSGA